LGRSGSEEASEGKTTGIISSLGTIFKIKIYLFERIGDSIKVDGSWEIIGYPEVHQKIFFRIP